MRALLELLHELPERARVEAEVEGQGIGIGEAQRRNTPDAYQRLVVRKRRIADLRHPVVIVVGGMVDAVIAREAHVYHGAAKVVEEHGVIGAAADARLDQIRRLRRVVRLVIAHPGRFPGSAQGLAVRCHHRAARLDEHRRERGHRVGREAEALGSGGGGGAAHGFIDVQVGDELVTEVVGELLAPFGRAGEAVLLAVPAAGDERAPRPQSLSLELAEIAREFQHRGACR